MQRILLTNDDGIHAPGLEALEAALGVAGDLTIVAPNREMSGTGQSLTLHEPLRVSTLDERHYAVSGTPADAVILALHRLLPFRPDLCVSGINAGANLGENVIYSGTVAAAMEATLHGIPAMAVSLASRTDTDFAHAASFAAFVAAKVLVEGLPRGVMLNVNVPRGVPRGVRLTRQSQKISQNVIHEKHDPRGRPYFWQDETIEARQIEPDSDYAAIFAHEISVTPLQVDRTDYKSLNHLSPWLKAFREHLEKEK